MAAGKKRRLAPLLVLPVLFAGLYLYLLLTPMSSEDPPPPTQTEFLDFWAEHKDDLIQLLAVKRDRSIDGYLGHRDMPISLMSQPGVRELQQQLIELDVKGLVATDATECSYFILFTEPLFSKTHYRGIALCPIQPPNGLIPNLDAHWNAFLSVIGATDKALVHQSDPILALQPLESDWYTFAAFHDYADLIEKGRF